MKSSEKYVEKNLKEMIQAQENMISAQLKVVNMIEDDNSSEVMSADKSQGKTQPKNSDASLSPMAHMAGMINYQHDVAGESS